MKRSDIEVGGVYEMQDGKRCLVEAMSIVPEAVEVFWKAPFETGSCRLYVFAGEAVRRIQ